MPTPKRILVATDFSEHAEAALAYAVDLAKALGAKVTLLHAFQLPAYDFPTGGVVMSAEMMDMIIKAAEEALAAACKKHSSSGVAIATVLRQGIAWATINQVAEEIGADLVVLGTHGRRGIGRALLGSVAEKIVRTAAQPVLTLHANQ